MTLCLNLHHCTGSREIGGPHIEISETLRCQPFFQVQENDYKRFNGLISNVCDERFSATKVFEPPEINTCWRVKDSQILCPGTRTDVHDLVVSIPVILGIEVGDETAGRNRHRGAKRQHWYFPETITPDSEEVAIDFDLIYDLVGFVLVNTQGTHFIARYATHDRTKIYTYDGMRHNGYPVHSLEMTFDTHMAGKKPKIPKGFIIWEAIYSLRGGLMAQEKFYQIRIKKYAAQYNLSFSEATLDKLPTVSYHQAGFREMDKKDHVWLLQPERKGTTEYISNPSPSLPLAPDGPESEEKTDIHPASQVSLPDSDFALNCCCGAVSNANIAYHQDDGEAVQCNECRDWSHVACQQDGRVSSLGKNEIFLCDSCDLEAIKHLLPSRGSATRASERK